MKHLAPTTALALSLTLGFAAAPPVDAQPDAAIDEDIATTPSDLTELLGPDGLEGAVGEFYLHMQMTGFGENGVMHWQTAIEDGQLVHSMRQSQGEEGMSIERQVFTAEGEFVESSSTHTSPGYNMSATAVREGNKVRVTNAYSFDGEPGEAEEEVFDYKPMDNMIPTAWLPIAMAYHIREGNERFMLRMSDQATDDMSFVQVFTADHVGTEMVEVGGEAVEAHVFMMAMTTEMGGEAFDGGVDDDGQQMQMYVLADGSIVRMRMEMEGMTMSAEAITAEEAEELMQAMGEGEGDGDDAIDGVGGEIEDAGDAIEDAAE